MVRLLHKYCLLPLCLAAQAFMFKNVKKFTFEGKVEKGQGTWLEIIPLLWIVRIVMKCCI